MKLGSRVPLKKWNTEKCSIFCMFTKYLIYKNKKMKKYLFILVSIIFSSCASVYITKEGQAKADKHESIAILVPKVGFKQAKK